MNSKTFYRLMLLIPFFTFLESIGYFVFYDTTSGHSSLLGTINGYWNYFAVFWLAPYGILMTYLLFWSRKKTVDEIQDMFSSAPIMLMFLVGGTNLLLGLVMSIIGEESSSFAFGEKATTYVVVALVSIPASLMIGYGFVAISFLIHRLFKHFGLIHD